VIDLSICIVTHNDASLVKDCLESIYKETKSSFEIFVVDNGSTDNTLALIRNNYPEVKIIENGANLGYPVANNRAIKQSVGRYILLLNPDTLVLDAGLDKLVAFLDSHPEAAVVGPQFSFPDGSFQFSYDWGISIKNYFIMLILAEILSLMKFINPFRKQKFEETYTRKKWRSEKTIEVGRVRGCCMLVRREVIEQIGMLDEQFFIYCEEVDWQLRMKKAGWKAYFFPDAKIIHYWGASTRQRNRKNFNAIQWQSIYKYFKKYYGYPGVLLLRCMVFFHALIKTARLVAAKLTGRMSEEITEETRFIWKVVLLDPYKPLQKK
jgi:hypothetical protein